MDLSHHTNYSSSANNTVVVWFGDFSSSWFDSLYFPWYSLSGDDNQTSVLELEGAWELSGSHKPYLLLNKGWNLLKWRLLRYHRWLENTKTYILCLQTNNSYLRCSYFSVWNRLLPRPIPLFTSRPKWVPRTLKILTLKVLQDGNPFNSRPSGIVSLSVR